MKKINKLWQAGSTSLHPLVEAFTVGDDYIFDQRLLPYDVKASIAHAQMLHSMGILNKEEINQAEKGLNEIMSMWQAGEFTVQKEQEDGHTAIEQYLTQQYGEVGKKIHTGRSRNDQSLVMIRLFMKESLDEITESLANVIDVYRSTGDKYKQTPMPGYTHMQKAMPTTVGVWLTSFADALCDFRIVLQSVAQVIDQNPLGSASGFGIENLPLQRDKTTELLGFAQTQQNPMYCGLSRGYFELIVLQVLSQPMIISARFAQDMLLFTTSEFDFFSLPQSYTTGSSIMPQKRNYDLFEIMRGNAKVFLSYQDQVQQIVTSLSSGYQRDLQLTKKPFVQGVHLCLDTLEILFHIIKDIQVHEENLKKAMTDDLFVTNDVYNLVMEGMSFRDAYDHVKKKWAELT